MKYQARTTTNATLPNDLRNEFIAHGWRGANEIGTNEIGANEIGANEMGTNEIGTNEMDTTFVYRRNNPYDEFIIHFAAYNKVEVTVPIPFKDTSMSYKNTFDYKDMPALLTYIKMHLANYSNNTPIHLII